MGKGIIYIMTTIVPGLIKIGRTGSCNFEHRMYQLEHHGYNNVTGLQRAFAIEVDSYEDKENLLHTIFEKSRVADTELFAINLDIVTRLLSSFDGKMIYPKNETKEDMFSDAAESSQSKLIPDGTYFLKKKKLSDQKVISATATIKNGAWTLKKGSIVSMTEGIGASQKAKAARLKFSLDSNGKLLEDAELGICAPSMVGSAVVFAACGGWTDWKNEDGISISIYQYKDNTKEE